MICPACQYATDTGLVCRSCGTNLPEPAHLTTSFLDDLQLARMTASSTFGPRNLILWRTIYDNARKP